jgi:uncharacterized RDD family membrane protein YckC
MSLRNTEPAGFVVRALAATIDSALFLLLSVPLMWMAYGEKVARIDDVRPWSIAINWLLPFVLTMLFWSTIGSTPGKVLMSVTIVDAKTGGPASLAQCIVRWFAYLLSAAPLGLGFLWAAIDTDKQAWHDKLARTRVVQPRRSSTGRHATRGYFAAHWHGELPLSVSFWVNNILLALPVGLALGGLMAWISLKGEMLQASSIAALVGWPLMLVMDAWSIVGAWRSATRHVYEGGVGPWSSATKFVLVLSIVGTGASTFLDFLPQLGSYIQMARGIDPIGQVEIALSPDGRSVKLTGPLGMGDGTRVRQALEHADKLRVVELASPGGRVFEANRIAELVRSGAWQTRAIGNCESACTLVFMAGSSRQLMPGAQLGFHRAFAGTFNPVIDRLINQELAVMYRRAGLPEHIIEKTLQTPPWAMWYPGIGELAQGGLITAPQWTIDVALPPRTASAPSDMEHALRASHVWHALEQRYPGSITTAAKRMDAARARNATDVAVQTEGHRVAHGLLHTLLHDASPQAREHYVVLLAQQLRSARAASNQACRSVLAGDAGARRALPQELVLYESRWMVATASAPPTRGRAHRPSALELEVIRRSLGDEAPARLAQLWGSPGRGGGTADCDAAIALLEQVARLQTGPRQLAAQLMFQRP